MRMLSLSETGTIEVKWWEPSSEAAARSRGCSYTERTGELLGLIPSRSPGKRTGNCLHSTSVQRIKKIRYCQWQGENCNYLKGRELELDYSSPAARVGAVGVALLSALDNLLPAPIFYCVYEEKEIGRSGANLCIRQYETS